MSKRIGNKGKVTIGDNRVVGIGTWTINGISSDKIEVTELGDDWKSYMFGLKDGGDVGLDGHFDPDDAQGQEMMRLANLYNSQLTSLKFWIDNTSFFMPCQTTGYFSPTLTTGAPTRVSYINVTSYDVKKDKAAVDTTTFKGTVSGVMVLV